MTKPRLAIDLDGVCADFMGFILSLTNTDKNDADYYFHTGNISSKMTEVLNNVVNKPETYANLEMIRDSQESLVILSEFYDIYYVTGRDPSITSVTNQWLNDRHYPNANEVTFTQDKGITCLSLGVQCAVEDQVKYAEDIANCGTKVWLFDRPYNKSVTFSSDLVKRVHCWEDLTFFIMFPSRSEKIVSIVTPAYFEKEKQNGNT